MIMDEADQSDRTMKEKLYQLFFTWKQETDDDQDLNEDNKLLLTEEEKAEKEK